MWGFDGKGLFNPLSDSKGKQPWVAWPAGHGFSFRLVWFNRCILLVLSHLRLGWMKVRGLRLAQEVLI